MSSEQEFCVNLEIKSNGSRLVSGWTPFKFVLKAQEFVPYLVGAGDDHTPRGCLKIAGCQAAKLPFDVNDGKKYTFKLASESTAYVFNAPNEITRERVITLLNFASAVPQWFNPYSLTSIIELSDDVNEVSRVFFSSLHAKVAARRIQGFFFGIRSKKRVARLAALYPELYLVSVNKVDVVAGKKELFAYVSGLVVQAAAPTSVQDIFFQAHKTTVPVCMSSTPHITSDNAFHVAIASYDSALSYLSVSLFDVADVGKDQQESLGIAFVPLSDVPRRHRGVEYTPYTTTLPLEPYQVPDLSVVVGNPTPPSSGPTSPPAGPLTAHGHDHPAEKRDEDAHSVVSSALEVETVTNTEAAEQHTLGAKRPSITAGPSTIVRGASLRHAVFGNVTLTILTPHPSYSMCGWLLKKSDTFMFGGSYRPYWFVLMNGELQYFQQQKGNTVLTLDQPKKIIQCQNITAITVKNGVISISFKQKGVKGVWCVKIDPNHIHSRTPAAAPTTAPSSPTTPTSVGGSPNSSTHGNAHANGAAVAASALQDAKFSAMLERMWVRKLVRCSANVADPDLKQAASKGLFASSAVNARPVSPKTHSTAGNQHELVRVYSKERRPSVKVL